MAQQINPDNRPTQPAALAFAAGIVTLLLGVSSFLGLALAMPRVASWGVGLIPMAPSTAGLFFLCGLAVCLRSRRPPRRGAYRFSLAAGCLTVSVSALLFATSSRGIYSTLEHLGLSVSGTLGLVPIGHMSPLTALCFMLAGLSLLCLPQHDADRPRRTAVSFIFSVVLLAVGFVLLLFYIVGNPLLYGGKIIPPAINTVIAFEALGSGLLLLTGRLDRLFGVRDDERRTKPFLIIFTILAFGSIAACSLFQRSYERKFRHGVEQQLAAVSELKADELTHWHEERLGEGDMLIENPALSSLVRRSLLHPGDAEAQHRLEKWLDAYVKHYSYDRIVLIDAHGVARVSWPAAPGPVPRVIARQAPEILRSGKCAFQDFFRDELDQRIYLAVLVPIIDDAAGGQPLGLFVLRIDPTTYLFPFIQKWHAPSRTAETLLIRREGNNALFLNELRFMKNAALNLRIPLDRTDVPAVRAVLGQEGIVEGMDYHGLSTIAAVRRIPGSPWFIVSRMDVSEVFAPVRERIWLMIGSVFLLSCGAGAVAWLFWRQQRLWFYREQFESAEALRESEERYRTIIETAHDVVWVLDAQGNVVYVNRQAEDVYGYRVSDLIGASYSLKVHEEDLAKVRMMVARTSQGQPQNYEARIYDREGKLKTLLVNAVPLYKGKSVNGSVNFGRDITERKQAEEALHKLKKAVDTAKDAIFITDLNGVFTYVNPGFTALYGFTADEVVGKETPRVIKSGALEPSAYAAFWQTLLSGREVRGELVNKTKDGVVITVEGSSGPIFDDAGNIIGFLGIQRDITGRKAVEEELIKAHKLESLAILAGGIAHDFNNLLTGVVGNISLARHNVDPKSGPFEVLGEAESALFQAKSLTQQLLTFSKGGVPVKKLTILSDLIKESANFSTHGSKVKCDFHMDPDLRLALVDPGQIGQVISNITINAVQAMPEGGGISFQVNNVVLPEGAMPLPAGPYVRITVKDTGVGIPAQHLTKIFDPFFTTKQTGSGLGLATSYSIVKKHDGHIAVESAMGKGASFTIYLPAYTGDAPAPEPAPPAEMEKGRGRLLVMDDEPMIRAFLTKALTQLGYAVETVADGDRAVARYRETWNTEESFDAVILDLTVPGGKGGQEAILELREINPHIKALVSSGYANDPVLAEFKDYGFSAMLPKPYNAQGLSQALRSLLRENA